MFASITTGRTPPARRRAVLEADAPVVIRTPPRDVHETFVAVLDRQSGERVVTVIEGVSPTNKYAGPGLRPTLPNKRNSCAAPSISWKSTCCAPGPHVLAVPEHAARMAAEYDYLVCVNRGADRATRSSYTRAACANGCRACASRWPKATRTWSWTCRPCSPRPTKPAATPTAFITTSPAYRRFERTIRPGPISSSPRRLPAAPERLHRRLFIRFVVAASNHEPINSVAGPQLRLGRDDLKDSLLAGLEQGALPVQD